MEEIIQSQVQSSSGTPLRKFSDDIRKFNTIYRLPVSDTPTLDVGVPVLERLRCFKDILLEEVAEIDDIMIAFAHPAPAIDVLTDLADLLGDIQVYCASELTKFGVFRDLVIDYKALNQHVSNVPTLDIDSDLTGYERLHAFKVILVTEVNKIDDIINGVKNGASQSETLSALANLLEGIQVWCSIEMGLFGIPRDRVLDIIMRSNFSKLDANGLPIYDERGKVKKGPNYWKPEPEINQFLSELIAANQ